MIQPQKHANKRLALISRKPRVVIVLLLSMDAFQMVQIVLPKQNVKLIQQRNLVMQEDQMEVVLSLLHLLLLQQEPVNYSLNVLMQTVIKLLVKINQLHVNGLLQQELQPVLAQFIHVTQLQRELQNVFQFLTSMHLNLQFVFHQVENVFLVSQVI